MASGAGPCDAIMAATAHQCENGRSSGEEWSEVGSSQSESGFFGHVSQSSVTDSGPLSSTGPVTMGKS